MSFFTMMDEPIAIIGLDARLPGDGDTAERFYESLIAGRSARGEVPQDRYNAEAFWHPDAERQGSTHARHGHFLKGSVSAFDAPFFSITPTEAKSMDPQQRGMLESVYKALENAGVPLTKAAGTLTGVYVGCFTADYNDITVKDLDLPSKYAATGTVASMLSNRVSWFYDFRGPSLTIDTACSSSLVAAHEACMSLKLGEIDMAIVGGCNLILTPEMTLKLGAAGVLGPDGKSQSFDSRGNGYARGEGFGTLVLKRVKDAVRDGDVIRAVIRNSSTNQDGRSPGITQPTKGAQAALIRHVYRRANLDPSLTRFFEAHGTGTAVGDPIEASAIGEIFAPHRSPQEPLYVGALKSNVGHLEGAAGVAAIIKGVLTLENGVIPPNIWFEKKNPKIQDSWNLKFPTEPTPWPQDGLRRMSINSFGIGGSNAHVVMDDALHFLEQNKLTADHKTEKNPRKSLFRLRTAIGLENISPYSSENSSQHSHDSATHHDAVPRLLVLSAQDQPGVTRLRDAYSHYLAAKFAEPTNISKDVQFMGDISYTLSTKRTNHPWRTFALATCPSSLADSLRSTPQATRAVSDPRLGFVFTGQGAQWPAMGLELMVYRTFRQSLFLADTYLNDLGCPWSLVYEMTKTGDACRLDNPEFCQPICTALQVALVDLLASWNIRPHAITGHSSGEVAGAYAAGAISREAAWKISYYRGKLSAMLCSAEDQPKTGMAAVGLDSEKTQASIDRINEQGGQGTLQIACFNSWNSHTVSGDIRKIDALVELLSSEKTFARKLNVDIGYHSQYMQAMADEYLESMGELASGSRNDNDPKAPQFFSSTLGTYVPTSQLRDPAYWVKNLVSPVRFAESATAMLKGSTGTKLNAYRDDFSPAPAISDILEIGPHSALKGPLSNISSQIEGKTPAEYHSVLRRKSSAVETTLEAAGSLFCRGYGINLQKINDEGQNKLRKPCLLTDLPSYPFNHSVEYWNESRISKAFRLRKHGRHELLGAPVADWNKNNATWHNYIRLSENPWVEHHKVSGEILYPAAGMLVMAVEASRQIADEDKILKGLRFRDVSFHAALRVPEDAQGIESYFYLRPCRESSVPSPTTWHEFQLCTSQEDEWTEHCRGLVQIEYQSETNADKSLEDELLKSRCDQLIQTARDNCKTTAPKNKVYRALQDSGLEFGTTFQALSDTFTSDDLGIFTKVNSTVPLIRDMMPHQYVQPHLIHPAMLDGLVHANLAPLVVGSSQPGKARVPIFAEELWIAAGPQVSHDAYLASAKAQLHGRHDAKSSVTAVHPETGEPLVYASGLVFKALPGSSSDSTGTEPAKTAFNIDWKPDPNLITEEQSQEAFGLSMTAEEDPTNWMKDCEALCFAYIRCYLDSVTAENSGKLDLQWHHVKYVEWMRHVVDRLAGSANAGDVCELEAKVRARNAAEGKLIIAVGQALDEMLGGPRDPLDVIFGNKIAEEVYREGLGSKRCYVQLCNYIDALAHQNPALKVLEIGAGTGGATRPVMETLTKNGRRFQHYEFTDISPSFFEKAREFFKEEVDSMGFKVLNVENDPVEQGFEAGTYDVVLAANVLHATKNIDASLSHARKLLRPGGKLVLFEITNLEILLSTFCFGVLPGWWLSEDKDRVWGPLMSPDSWRLHLVKSGFSGLEGVFHDFPGSPHQMSSILVSTNPSADYKHLADESVYMIADQTSPLQQGVADGLSQFFGENATRETAAGTEEDDFAEGTCIFLPELESSLLHDISDDDFATLKHILMTCKVLVWLTRGGVGPVPEAKLEMVTGLARVAREERPELKFLTISFSESESQEVIIDRTIRILKNMDKSPDNNFRVSNGLVHVPRLVQDSDLTKHVQNQTGALTVQETEVSMNHSEPLALQIGTIGQLDSIRFEVDETSEKPLLDDEVEFQVMACSLNARDLASARGKIDEVPFGLEAAGLVTRTGRESKFQTGDRVFGLVPSGSMKTHARTSENFLRKLWKPTSWIEASSTASSYTTAYAVLLKLGSLDRGDAVLVSLAATSVGQALLHVAQSRGASIFATVKSSKERELLQTTWEIPQEQIFFERDPAMASVIKSATKGRGVSTAVGDFTSETLKGIWDCISPFGRVVDISTGESDTIKRLPTNPKNIRFETFNLAYRAAEDSIRTQSWFQEVFGLVNVSHRASASVYSFSQVREAFQKLQSGDSSTNVVLERREAETLLVLPSRKAGSDFDANASYVIAGGLGGLGKSVSRWMASRGAKNLILLSRRGPVEDSAKAFVEELESAGVRVAAPACDVTDQKLLESTFDDLKRTMPPVKGCIQGSMVLRDNRIQNMTVGEWNEAVRSKVDTSLNLNKALAPTLEFFVLLSSTVGITGNPEQSNYSAGNTFQDAFAKQLRSQGVNAVTINLPVIRGAGFVAEKPELMDYMRSTGWAYMEENELHAVLDYHCRQAQGLSSLTKAQVVPRFWLPQETAKEGYQLPNWRNDPLFSQLAQSKTSTTEGAASTKRVNHAALLSGATTIETAEKVVLEALLLKISRVLSVDVANLDAGRPLHAYGVDSLVAVELRSWLGKELGADVSVFDITSKGSISQLAVTATEKSKLTMKLKQ